MADDCPFQYCAGFECFGDECFAAPQQARRAGKRACLHFRLFGGNGAGVIRGEPEYGFPLICGMIGSAVLAIISVGSGVQALSIGVGGIPGILSINPQFWGSFALAMAGRAEEIERGGERQRARACGCRAARRLACGGGVYRADFLPVFLSVQDES